MLLYVYCPIPQKQSTQMYPFLVIYQYMHAVSILYYTLYMYNHWIALVIYNFLVFRRSIALTGQQKREMHGQMPQIQERHAYLQH